jgi:hypothetical protein
MADETTVYGQLTSYAPFSTLIGGPTLATRRFWDQQVPVQVAQPVPRPYVIATNVSANPEIYMAAAPGPYRFLLQFDIYADSKAQAKTVLAQLRAAMTSVGHYGERAERDLPADDPNLRRISSEWEVWL